jgi:DNA-binding transcriptional regulator PaaX
MEQSTKEKIMLLLYTGVALGFTYSPNQLRKTLRLVGKEWKKIDENQLKREIKSCYRSKLIKEKENADGSLTYVLTEKGIMRVLTYNFCNMKIEHKAWDGKWRAVIFDIPEKIRWGRDALRKKLRELGFCEFQKSVFVFPYNCKNEIDFIIEFFKMRKYVRYGVFDYVDNEPHLKQFFNLG